MKPFYSSSTVLSTFSLDSVCERSLSAIQKFVEAMAPWIPAFAGMMNSWGFRRACHSREGGNPWLISFFNRPQSFIMALMMELHTPKTYSSNELMIDEATRGLIRAALEEDHAWRDVSTLWTVSESIQATAQLLAKQPGILCGGILFAETFRIFDPQVQVILEKEDGSTLETGQVVARITGTARSLLSAERVALNLIGRFSGIATLTQRYVEAVRGTRARICDTRKTAPLWRRWDKYAVRMGGGTNHRSNLEEMVLLKDNHVALAGGAAQALRLVKQHNLSGVPIEVEVDNLKQLAELLEEGVDRVLLDNMTPAEIVQAVGMVSGNVELEASGGVRLETVHDIAETGVDFISIGGLTHSVTAFDFSLEIETNGI